MLINVPLGLLLSAFLLTANSPAVQSDSQQDAYRVEVEAVNVLVTVNDKRSGTFITDLLVGDFEVLEDGVLQRVTNFSKQTNLPLTIALCVDTSASVKLKLEFEKEAALDFLFTLMRPSDRALLVEFDTGVTLLQDFTSNPNDLTNEIKKLRAGGGTSLYDAVYLVSEQKMLAETGRKTLVVLSDGTDLTSTHTYDDAERMALLAETTIYALSTTRFGANIDHEGDNALRQLTEATGGQVYFPYSTSQLTKSFNEINEALRSQYNIAYAPANRNWDGAFREIAVKVDRSDVVIRHRKGYYAPRISKPAPKP